jgi:hypothetical protein
LSLKAAAIFQLKIKNMSIAVNCKKKKKKKKKGGFPAFQLKKKLLKYVIPIFTSNKF